MTDSWRALSREAPELASSITACFEANLHHVVGTIRGDGSVRLSGTEIAVTTEEIRFGMMPGSHKLSDVRRDNRVEVHSAPLDPKLVDGDVKLGGRLIESGATDGQPGTGFVLDISSASLVRVVGDQLVFTVWSPSDGLRTLRRQ